MSWAELTAETDIELVQKRLEYIYQRQNTLVDAINGLGANVQWIIDNVQGIFQMFQSPQFMANLPGMMSGGDPVKAAVAMAQAEKESHDGPDDSD